MKNKKFTAISCMLATAFLSLTAGGVLMQNTTKAEAEDTSSYTITDIFSSSNSAKVEAKNNVTAFTLPDEGAVSIKRPLALKWYDETGDLQYFSVKFAFETMDFTNVTLEMDTASAWSTKKGKTTNALAFRKDGSSVKVSVNGGAEKTVDGIQANTPITMSLFENQTRQDGEFGVNLTTGAGTQNVGSFTNVGANYAEYSANEQYPIRFTAEETTATVLLYDINGQKFDGLSGSKLTDTAKPVLVVNQEIDKFTLGTQFALDYNVMDVLETTTGISKTLEFYQWNPAIGTPNDDSYHTLSTSTYFMSTTYYEDGQGQFYTEEGQGRTAKSVYDQNNAEYVSIRITLSDNVKEKAVYDFSKYASLTAKEEIDGVHYILIDETQSAPAYTCVTANDTAKANTFDKNAYDNLQAKKDFDEALEKAASEVYSGSNSYIYFPSFKWFINDNNGYRNMKFTISYKKPTATTPMVSSNLSYNGLKLAVAEAGTYEFKIYATDTAGNTMNYYLDGEKVALSNTNVWDIEEIPSFSFTIAYNGIKVEDPDRTTEKKQTIVKDKLFTMNSIKVSGATNLKSNYKLFKVDFGAYNNFAEQDKKLTTTSLYNVSYETLAEAINLNNVVDGNYFDLYLDAYVKVLAKNLKVTDTTKIEKLKSCFVEIKAYDERITKDNAPEEWNAYNKYNWNPEEKTFAAVEEGSYLLLADFWEKDLAHLQRASGYKVAVVNSQSDVIKGENNWIEKNIVSVILFSIAGVLLIVTIVLFLIKPTDETLEDVDKKIEKIKKENNQEK